jgi:fumarate hydratase, class I
MSRAVYFEQMLELIRRTSVVLPQDVTSILAVKQARETQGSKADLALRIVLQNIGLAKQLSAPICQDTGTITFYIRTPVGFDQLGLQDACCDAVVEATKRGYLRQNSVDSITGRNSGTNLGPGSPVFHWHQHRGDNVDVRLILKGGGCENMSAQYSLPATINGKRFDRDLEGVRGVVLDAVWQAQGKGCGPGFLGVCIGGDRAIGYEYAKEQLLRTVEDVNPHEELAKLEARILEEANKLDIGPMGFGGKLTVGGVKIGARNRLPASFFVTIAYMCWAYRRRGLVLDKTGEVVEWLYQEPGEFDQVSIQGFRSDVDLGNTKAIPLTTPLSTDDVKKLRAGDVVLLSGTVYTGRDEVHKYLYKGGDLPFLKDGVIYHCGPVVVEEGGKYRVLAAGPTTSIREEPYQADIIARYGIKAVIGKGGMGAKTQEACQKYGCVYLHAIGGAAQIYAQTVTDVTGVDLKDKFGSPEAVWHLVVKNLPAIVTIDSHGRSLHAEVAEASKKELAGVL